MILKLTIYDNTYHEDMLKFCKKLLTCIPIMPPEPDIFNIDAHFEHHYNWIRMNSILLNAFCLTKKEMNQERTEALMKTIQYCFNNFIDFYTDYENDIRVYLKERFNFSIVNSIIDQRQNYEIYYIVTNSNAQQIICL